MTTKKQMMNVIRPQYNALGIYTLSDIKSKHNGYFFTTAAMKFFNSRLVSGSVYCGAENVYFVSSEQFDAKTSRLFTVRMFNVKTKSVDTFEKFQQYATKAQAVSAALEAAYNEVAGK